MASINVIAGNIRQGKWSCSTTSNFIVMTISWQEVSSFWPKTDSISIYKRGYPSNLLSISQIEQLTEEKVKKLAGTAGWGLAGAALLGPIGAIGGFLIGGNKTEVSFVCNLSDGKKFMGVTDIKTYQSLLALGF